MVAKKCSNSPHGNGWACHVLALVSRSSPLFLGESVASARPPGMWLTRRHGLVVASQVVGVGGQGRVGVKRPGVMVDAPGLLAVGGDVAAGRAGRVAGLAGDLGLELHRAQGSLGGVVVAWKHEVARVGEEQVAVLRQCDGQQRGVLVGSGLLGAFIRWRREPGGFGRTGHFIGAGSCGAGRRTAAADMGQRQQRGAAHVHPQGVYAGTHGGLIGVHRCRPEPGGDDGEATDERLGGFTQRVVQGPS